MFPDSSAYGDASDWRHCCVVHDIAYWRGGSAGERKKADAALRQCVIDATDNEVLGDAMYRAVRGAGGPYLFTWFRWGYGWEFGRGYAPLSEEERDAADALLAEYLRGEEADASLERFGGQIPSGRPERPIAK